MASTPHFVLEFFFPNLTTLHQYLATNINQNSHLIVQDDDNPDYKQFLFTTLIGEENKSDTGGARAPGAKVRQRSFPRNSIREDGMKQNEIVNGVIEALFRMAERENIKAPSHMLTLGYRKIRCETGHGGLSGMSGLTDIENHFPNTLVNEVKSRWWSLLLERIGDTAMIYILTYTAVFLALPNGSYCQITGTPISELPLPSAAMNSTVRIRGGAFQPPICGDDGASRRENAVTRMDRSEQAEETEVAQPLNSGLVKVTKKRKKNNADLFPGETLTLAERSQKKRRMGGTDRSEDAEHRPTIVTGAEAQARSKEEVDTILDRGEIYIERPQKKKRRMDDMERTKDDEHRMSVAVGTDVQAKLKEEANIIPDEAESQLERPQKKPRVGGIAGSRDDEHHLNLAVSVKLQAKSRRKKWRAISDGSEIKIERLQKKGTGSIREFKDSKRRPSSTVVAEIRATSRNKEEPDEISDGSKSQTERSQKKQRLDGTRRLSEAADNEGCQTPTGCEEPQAKSRKNKQKRKRQNEVRDDEAASGGNNVEKKGRDSVIVGEADGSRKKRVNLGEITVGDGKNKRNESTKTTSRGKLPSSILFARASTFYSRPVYGKRGQVIFGLPTTHILKRYRSPSKLSKLASSLDTNLTTGHLIASSASCDSQNEAVEQILKHVFPHQFKLKSAFVETTSQISDRHRRKAIVSETREISTKSKTTKIPWRLRPVVPLVQRMMLLHSHCRYIDLLKYYCPVQICDANIERNAWTMQSKENTLDTAQSSGASRDSRNAADESRTGDLSGADQHLSDEPSSNICSGLQVAEADPPEVSQNPITYFSNYFQVSSFVQAVFKRVIPRSFCGSDTNQKVILNVIDRFVRLRRYETISLHEVLQGFKLNDCLWLVPRELASGAKDNCTNEYKLQSLLSSTDDKLAALQHMRVGIQTGSMNRAKNQKPHVPPTETEKRREILMEFIYWLFDSFIMPLIKTNFYVTETGPHRNRIFYFRQDLWLKICGPALYELKLSNFKEVTARELPLLLKGRKLSYSYIRLLPKEKGVRPIINLRRKVSKDLRSAQLGPSINTILQNTFQILTFEKSKQPEVLGASVLGVNEIYQRLKPFKERVFKSKLANQPFYFAKVDLTRCFDSIDQLKLLEIVRNVVKNDEYMLQRYAMIYPSGGKLRKTFIKRAITIEQFDQFPEFAYKLAESLKYAVLIDNVDYPLEYRQEVLDLLEEHVQNNLIKFGKKFYRQVIGIPQGSCLSALLCSYFYGDLEKNELSFIASDENGVLLRYFDDFLYISLSKHSVARFVQAMYKGHPTYGCFINKGKSLVNFDLEINGIAVPKLLGSSEFPWCGLMLHTKTLDVMADYKKYCGTYVNDAISVETSRHPGEALVYKLMQLLKPKSHAIFMNTSLNSTFTVLRNIYQNFLLCAMKFHHHARGLPNHGEANQKFLKNAVFDILLFGPVLFKSRAVSPTSSVLQFKYKLNELQIIWLGAHAFFTILSKKQTNYQLVLRTLDKTLRDKQFDIFRKKLAAVVDPRLSKDFFHIFF